MQSAAQRATCGLPRSGAVFGLAARKKGRRVRHLLPTGGPFSNLEGTAIKRQARRWQDGAARGDETPGRPPWPPPRPQAHPPGGGQIAHANSPIQPLAQPAEISKTRLDFAPNTRRVEGERPAVLAHSRKVLASIVPVKSRSSISKSLAPMFPTMIVSEPSR